MQAAVPKFIQLNMAPVASNILPPSSSGQLTQNIRVTNSMHGQKPIVLRLKIDFTIGMQAFSEVVEVANFPPGL
jgi:AP-1 complex subunit gamma-1